MASDRTIRARRAYTRRVSGRSASDETLTHAVREGDLAAFDELYARYERRLFAYVRRWIPERARAEDVFQEVFLTVLRDRTFDPDRGRFATWLFTVARNRCLGEHRHSAKHSHIAEQLPRAVAVEMEPAFSEADRVRQAMAALPEPQRQLLLLKQVAELTYREIAAVLGVAEGTIKSRLHAATQAFRAQLAEGGEPG